MSPYYVARLLAINAVIYGKERSRNITHYRVSYSTLCSIFERRFLTADLLTQLSCELLEINWALIDLGTEFESEHGR